MQVSGGANSAPPEGISVMLPMAVSSPFKAERLIYKFEQTFAVYDFNPFLQVFIAFDV